MPILYWFVLHPFEENLTIGYQQNLISFWIIF
jgi:hypothetical protein